MGWQIGFDSQWNRDIGYGVPAVCDRTACETAIDRGLPFVCGSDPRGGEHGCGLYFCGEHLFSAKRGDRYINLCGKCLFGLEPFRPKPDTVEWMNWKLSNESWAAWRAENQPEVNRLRAAVADVGGTAPPWPPGEQPRLEGVPARS